MIVLENKGLIDIDLITTMGANVKESESPIGYFGTGLKFAIATLLRNEVDFYLMIGESRFEFYAEPKTIRGKVFYLCYMRGPMDSTALGFTTELGKNWEVWQAYREIYSNCIDEGGEVCHDQKNYIPDSDCTAFVIKSEIDTGQAFLIDLDKPLLFESDRIEIYEGKSNHIYYRGIRAKDLDKPSMYTYNILESCTLTEDRMICHDWRVDEAITNTVAQMDDGDIVKNIVSPKPDNFENSLRFGLFGDSAKPNDHFIETFKSVSNPNPTIKSYIHSHTPRAPKNREERRADFLRNLTELCDEYDANMDHDHEYASVTITGGILGTD